MRRLRPLSEAECYLRCYGGWDQTVRRVAAREAPPRALGTLLAGAGVRRLFEDKLDSRHREAAREAA